MQIPIGFEDAPVLIVVVPLSAPVLVFLVKIETVADP